METLESVGQKWAEYDSLNYMMDLHYLVKQIEIDDEPEFVLDRYKHTEFLLVTTRNEDWMKNLIPMIHEDSSLIAVGATHLIGINGLIAKLRNLGYNVDPMR